MMAENFCSVGIDVGTTTTQIVFSRLFLERKGGFGSIPNVKIAKKDVVYKSSIHFTPLISHDIIDAARLKDIIADEFEKSEINVDDVSTGAVIITGESANKENAHEVAEQIAEYAGNFVVCTAGPDYEAVLAGWGAGAGDASKKLTGNVTNLDIGGGTTNAVVFNNGEVLDTYAADIGGRLVRVDSNGVITYISEKIRLLINSMGLLSIKVGQKAKIQELGILTNRMADMLLELLGDNAVCDDTKNLFIGHPSGNLKTDYVMFSGGVAEYIYTDESGSAEESIRKYGDIGPLLGSNVKKKLAKLSTKLLSPVEKIRATVIGAGSYSTEISGSTIAFNENVLPIKNVPIIKVSDSEQKTLGEKIAKYSQIYGNEQIAVAISNLDNPGYLEIKKIANEILDGLSASNNPVIVITECDCAKALGLVLRNMKGNRKPVVSLDKIFVENGNFIDIGLPLCGVVPVIVKTLIFNNA